MGGPGLNSENVDPSPILALLPRHVCRDVMNEKPHTLVVRRIQPKHPAKDIAGLLESPQPPEAQPESMHAAEEWAIVDPTPREHSLETLAQG